MARQYPLDHDAQGQRFCLIAARFNASYVERLVEAALGVLRQRGAAEEDLEVVWVPGSFELPVACRWAATSGRFDALLAFGTVIQGETEHHRIVAEVTSRGLLNVMLETGIPVVNGVLAVRDVEQAEARTGGRLGNRGAEAALAAVAMGRLKHAWAPR